MNRKNFIATILLLFLIFSLISCDNGSASNAGPNNLVKVSLFVGNEVSQRSVSVTSNMEWENFTFQYNAVPQWNGTNIQGATDWTNLNYSDGVSLGYFTPGQWIFGVRIFNGETPIYEGFSPKMNISTSSVEVTVMMRKIITEATIGSISINVTVPTIDGDYLNISCNSGAAQAANVERENGISTFTYSINNLVAGNYTITLVHPSANSGAVLAIDLREGEMAVISGHLDNGIWQVGYITVNIHSISLNKNEYGNVYKNTDYAAVNDKVSFTVEPFSGSIIQSLNISYVENEITKYVDYTTNGNLYSFYMPDFDVTINVVFKATDSDVQPAFFKSIVKGIYDTSDALSFGRSDTPPEVDYFAVKDVRIWFDTSTKKICWYSPNGNIIKFKSGSLAGLFKDFETLTSISLKGFDTSEITDMSSLFENCYDLKSVDFNGINTAEVKNMSKMFYHAGLHYFPDYETGVVREDQTHNHRDNSENIVISNMNFTTNKVENMSYMFSVCAVVDLSTTNMSSWDVAKVEDFSYMFAGESVAKPSYKYWYNKISGFNISSWNTISSTTFKNMFALCNRFTEINISGWKFDNVVYVDRMFERCECLGRVATQGNSEDNIKVVFPSVTKLTKIEDMLYWFGKDVEFRRENMKAIVESWDFTGNPNADALFANNANNDTSPETIPSNRIFSSECCSNTSVNYRQNFRTIISATTLDGRTLYFGGNGVRGQRIRSIE